VDAPGVEDPLVVDQLVAGTPHVVHHLVAAALDESLADSRRDVVERGVPADALPLPFPALTDALERVTDPLGVLHLVQRGGALGAVASAAARMLRVALELRDAPGVAIDVGEEPAGRLAVEADRGDEPVAARHLLRPRQRVVLLPVVPPGGRR